MGGDDIACELRGDDVPFVSHTLQMTQLVICGFKQLI